MDFRVLVDADAEKNPVGTEGCGDRDARCGMTSDVCRRTQITLVGSADVGTLKFV